MPSDRFDTDNAATGPAARMPADQDQLVRPVDDQLAADGDLPLTVVIAPDSFKGSLTAAEAAAGIAAGWRTVRDHDRLLEIPLADGGEGTVAAVAAARPDGILH